MLPVSLDFFKTNFKFSVKFKVLPTILQISFHRSRRQKREKVIIRVSHLTWHWIIFCVVNQQDKANHRYVDQTQCRSCRSNLTCCLFHLRKGTQWRRKKLKMLMGKRRAMSWNYCDESTNKKTPRSVWLVEITFACILTYVVDCNLGM